MPDGLTGAKIKAYHQGVARRERYLQLQGADPQRSPVDILAEMGLAMTTYRAWRSKYRDFAARVDVARGHKPGYMDGGWTLGGPRGDSARKQRETKAGNFGHFRKHYFDHDSPWFHLLIVEALTTAEDGSVTLILLPPEHGKTTVIEDFICWKLAIDPTFRITVVSEREAHGRKMIARVKNRMSQAGPAKQFVRDFGPFEPQAGASAHKVQAWAAAYMDVYRKGESDERDFNMVSVGIGSAIQGSRSDLMILDDVQSLRSLTQTESYVELIRQDFLSRTGAFGRVVLIGTRVGNDDVYERLEDAGIVDKVIRFPALDHNGKWLWPERYSEVNYHRMRRNVGEEAWARNYQQAPSASGLNHFTAEMLADASNPLRSVRHPVPAGEWSGIIVGVDPGFGINATVACAYNDRVLAPWAWRIDEGLSNNREIVECVAALYASIVEPGHAVPLTDVMFEDKAFQKGLLEDDNVLDLKRLHGCFIKGHQTGANKLDDTFGVPTMANSLMRLEMSLPGASDHWTDAARSALDAQLTRWRPGRRGTQLTQDLTMALWFAWLRWRQKLPAMQYGVSTRINTGGVPYGGPTKVRVGGGVR